MSSESIVKRAYNSIRNHFFHKSFFTYLIGGIIKTILGLVLLWAFEDKWIMPWAPTLTRIAVFMFIFLVTYYLYIWLGYANKKSDWKNFFKYSFSEFLKIGLNLMLMWIFIDLMALPIPNTIIRAAIIGFTFILIYFVNRWIGYAKEEEKDAN